MKVKNTLVFLITFLLNGAIYAQLISEFQPNPSGTDPNAVMFEISGTANTSFSGWVISADSDGPDGTINDATMISGTFDANGLLVVEIPDFENPSFVVFLTSEFTGTVGTTDIDTNDDGTADNLSTFGNIYDAIGIPDAAGDDVDNITYGTDAGGADFQYTGDEPQSVFRDGSTGDWYAVNDPAGSDVFDIDATAITGTDFDTDPTATPSTFGSINPSLSATTCTASLTAGSATCDAMSDATDTYTATFTFTIGSETEALAVSASAGTPDINSINTDGTITVTGVSEGTDMTLTLTNTNCELMATVTSPTCATPVDADARINEIAYDCGETGDPNEAIEVRIENSFAGNLSDLTVTLYNGSNGSSYDSETLDNFTVGTDDGTYTYYTWTFGANDIQNGSPDGISLDNAGTVIEFLSYEGTFDATDGVASGMTSTDINASQSNSSPCTASLQRSDDGTTWAEETSNFGDNNNVVGCSATLVASSSTCDDRTDGTDTYTATFTFTIGSETEALTVSASTGTPDVNSINADGTITVTGVSEGTDVTLTLTNTNCDLMATVTSPVCVPIPDIDARINEFSYDNIGSDEDFVEVRIANSYLAASARAITGTLADLTVTLYNGSGGASYRSERLDNFTVGENDGTYTYYVWETLLQNGSPDGISLDFQGLSVEFISYEGAFTATDGPATGMTSTDIGIEQSNNTTELGTTIQLDDNGAWVLGLETTGAPNGGSSSNFTAIGTCSGITSATENTFHVTIAGLDPAQTYDFDIDGDGTDDVTGITGTDTYTTSTGIAYVDGTESYTVQVDEGADGTYDGTAIIHEVLCVDIDDDGELDFNEAGCINEQGFIVSTVAPYTSASIYVYVLTNSNDRALAANASGVFMGIPSNGANGVATLYNIVALNFGTEQEVTDFINSLTFGENGSIVNASAIPPGCGMTCGIIPYQIDCTPAVALAPIPTMSEWGLMIFGLLVVNISVFYLRRKESIIAEL